MTQKEQGDFERIPGIRLYRGDSARLNEYYPQAGYNRVIRQLVRQHLNKLDARFEQRISAKQLISEAIEKGDIDNEPTS